MKKLIPLFSIVALPMVALNAHANSGSIGFEGKITDSTCTVSVDGQGADATIKLPTVSKDILKAEGDKAGKTNFIISMTGCTMGTGETKVSTYFEAGASVDVNSGFLINTGDAKNVALSLTDGTTNAPIKAGNQNQADNNTTATVADGAASLPYAVEYVASGAASAGTVLSSITFSLMYQ